MGQLRARERFTIQQCRAGKYTFTKHARAKKEKGSRSLETQKGAFAGTAMAGLFALQQSWWQRRMNY